MTNPPSIFEYTDFRKFLKDYYNYKKRVMPQFSYRYFSRKAGFSSPNFLKLVIEGNRNLTSESASKFCTGLKLNSSESQFFRKLVHFNQSVDAGDRAHFAQEILKILNRKKISSIKQSSLNYYACWYNIVIREMVALKNFKNDPLWIANQFQPPLKTSEVENSLKLLIDMGFLEYNENGKLVHSEISLNTENEVFSSLVSQYHLKMLDLAKESIDMVHREERELSAICVPISLGTAQKIKERIQAFREEILVLASEDQDLERVYQINMQLFPLTKNKENVE